MDLLKILILEDVEDDTQLMLRYLKRDYQFEHLWVEDEASYIKGLKNFKPDLILSDYMLPNFDGLQALKIRNETSPTTPFIIVTGSVNELTAVECIKTGATDYVTKEHLERLNVSVRNALEQKKAIEEKRIAQQQLLESLERFRTFVENDISGDYIENDHQVLYCNPRVLDIFDFKSLDELNEFGTENLYDDPNDRKRLFDRIKKNGKVKDFEVRMHTSMGKPLYLLENAIGKFDKNGQLIEVQGYIIDITQRKLAEIEGKKSEKLFRKLSETMSAGLVIYNEEHFLFVNPMASKITEYSIDEMLNMHFWDVVHPDHVAMIKERGLKRLRNFNIETNYTFKLLTKTGKERWINFTADRIEFKGQNCAIGTVFDITREKEAEAEIRRLSTVVEQNPLSIIITDTEGTIQYVNQSFVKITGYSMEEAIGENPRILQSGKTPAEIYPELWDTISAGKVWLGEFINKKKNGEEYIEYAVISPVLDEQGKIVQYAAIKEDITERKQMEQEVLRSKEIAEEANRLKSAFLANMSHELRTPLNGILGFSELMMDASSLEETREMTQFIHESGERLLRTLRLILDIARLEAGSFKPDYQKLDIKLLLTTLVSQYTEEAERRGIKLILQPFKEKLALEADEKMMRDTLEHLLDNAIKFTEEGSVTLSVNQERIDNISYIVFHIIDTGIGISEKNQSKIFEEFRQESEGYGRTYEGTGLGLSLARKYIELLGGFIHLKSKVGVGSTFSVYIPESPKEIGHQ